MKRAILWLRDNGHEAFANVVLGAFCLAVAAFMLWMIGMWLAMAVCWCYVDTWQVGAWYGLGVAGAIGTCWAFHAFAWPRLVAWAERPEEIPPTPPRDPFLLEAEREVERLLETQ